nr:hypothetical protein [Tanacetum cinerariifolium]
MVYHQVSVQVDHDVFIEDITCAKVNTDASIGLANERSSTSAIVHESPTTNNYALIHSGPISYAESVTGKLSRKNVNFCTLITLVENGADVAIPLESIRAISDRFANKAYGFFLGKWVAYPVVDNYVRNTYSKYKLVKSILNSSNGLFSFSLALWMD